MTGRSDPASNAPLLTVALITRDEEESLPRTLSAVAWADEILVVDCGSTDRSVEIARSFDARVEEVEWRGYGPQKARALELSRGAWVLSIDADEVVTPELAAEIRSLLSGAPECAGYEVEMHTWYLGVWFGTRGWRRERHLRLVRRDRARLRAAQVHERLEVDGPVGRLRGAIRHYSYRDVAHHMEKMARYTDLKARQLHEEGRRSSVAGAVAHAAWSFVSGYILQGGFLYGGAGLANELLGAHANLLAYLKLRELGRAAAKATTGGDAS
jgi:glycosyltransferase involved in cell wall biosynthesis